MQREAANPSFGLPARLLLYGASIALAVVFFFPLDHRLWPLSFMAVVAGPVVDGVRGRTLPRRQAAVQSTGDLGRELAALESNGYIVLSEVEAGRERVPFALVGSTGVFALRTIEWSGHFSLRRDGWFQHSKGDAGEVVWHASREAMAIKAALRKANVQVPVHGVVVATRSTIRGGTIDLGKVIFVEGHRLGGFIASRRHKVPAEDVVAAVQAISN
jgi:nuclease-like protein